MSSKSISLVLDDESHNEGAKSKDLRYKAATLVKRLDQISSEEVESILPDLLFELITQVIKPLFSGEQHGKLTSTGRKNLVNNTLPAAANRFSSQVLFDDDNRPSWKNGWTFSLLTYILESYAKLQDDVLRSRTIEAHFYLLVPPVLRQIDDVDITYKSYGCQCFKLLCDNLSSVKSSILERSGLTDVFVDALKNDFSLLPTLTPEDDSLILFQSLYPAFRSLISARFGSVLLEASSTLDSRTTRLDKAQIQSDEDLRQSYLTLLLRHQCLHSLSHLSTGTGIGSTMSISLSTFFLSQIAWITSDMGIHAVLHLQSVLPLLRNVLSDPFATSAPSVLLETAKTMRVVVQTCWPRVREKWWEECLRGIVVCWLNITDDETSIKDKSRATSLRDVKLELTVVACLLENVVGDTFVEVKDNLVEEEAVLAELFNITSP